MKLNIEFKNVKVEESSKLLAFIKEKADFDKSMQGFSGEIKTTKKKIEKTLFSNRPYSFAIFALVDDKEIGFAIYYFRYSSFQGEPILWLEDLLIQESYRGNKIGENFMKKLRNIAKTHGCSHMAWTASKYNIDGLRFYQRLGAIIYSKMNNSLFLKWEV